LKVFQIFPKLSYVLLLGSLALVAFIACSLEENKGRHIRGHHDLIAGIMHAYPAAKAPRYCKDCHGSQLVGGANAEPSCYKCHGEHWQDIPHDVSLAPADHTVLLGGYRHHPALQTPENACSECHGPNLEGSGRGGHPSCFLCHDMVW